MPPALTWLQQRQNRSLMAQTRCYTGRADVFQQFGHGTVDDKNFVKTTFIV
jgi:hypothetical protein